MKTSYLVYAFAGFLAWIILNNMGNEFKWIALGFGGGMLLFGVFKKETIKEDKEDKDKDKEKIYNLNKGGNKNDI